MLLFVTCFLFVISANVPHIVFYRVVFSTPTVHGSESAVSLLRSGPADSRAEGGFASSRRNL
eukprot:6779919-Pyramimonas_sp.AAC.1